MMNYSRVVYSVDVESFEEIDPDFYDWLIKQDDETIKLAVDDLAEQLMEYFDYFGDGVYDCLNGTKRFLKYEEQED